MTLHINTTQQGHIMTHFIKTVTEFFAALNRAKDAAYMARQGRVTDAQNYL